MSKRRVLTGNGPSPCPYRFVWSVRDKHMLSTVLDYNTDYAKGALPTDLPASFRQDTVALLPSSCPAAIPAPGPMRLCITRDVTLHCLTVPPHSCTAPT